MLYTVNIIWIVVCFNPFVLLATKTPSATENVAPNVTEGTVLRYGKYNYSSVFFHTSMKSYKNGNDSTYKVFTATNKTETKVTEITAAADHKQYPENSSSVIHFNNDEEDIPVNNGLHYSKVHEKTASSDYSSTTIKSTKSLSDNKTNGSSSENTMKPFYNSSETPPTTELVVNFTNSLDLSSNTTEIGSYSTDSSSLSTNTNVNGSIEIDVNSTEVSNDTVTVTEKPSPLLLTIVPDVSEIIAVDGTKPNLTCEVSGSNLPLYLPYTLIWYQRENAGQDVEVSSADNASSVAFDKALTFHDLNHEVFCAIKFNKLAPTVFAMVSSAYIKITRIKDKPILLTSSMDGFYNGSLASESENSDSTGLVLGVSIGAVVFFKLLVIIIIIIFHRIRKSRADSESRNSGVYATPDDPVYSYVPINVVSFYDAKALAASNQKAGMESIKPPPLPNRPPNMGNSLEYDYAYGSDRRPSRPLTMKYND